jgi:hypothetical protein
MPTPNPWDASIQQLYAVADGGNFAVPNLPSGDPYDVLCDLAIGENLNEHVDSFELKVSVINLSTMALVQEAIKTGTLTPADDTAVITQEKLDFDAPNARGANAGDVLQAVASYRVDAGSNTDFSTAQSATVVVS